MQKLTVYGAALMFVHDGMYLYNGDFNAAIKDTRLAFPDINDFVLYEIVQIAFQTHLYEIYTN